MKSRSCIPYMPQERRTAPGLATKFRNEYEITQLGGAEHMCKCGSRSTYVTKRSRGLWYNDTTGTYRRHYRLYRVCPLQSRRKVPFNGKKFKLFACAPPGSPSFPRLSSEACHKFCGEFYDDECLCDSEIEFNGYRREGGSFKRLRPTVATGYGL